MFEPLPAVVKTDPNVRLRLAVWVMAGGGALGGQLLLRLLIPSGKGVLFDLGYGCVVGCLGLIVGLLITTPANAIRLRRSTSEIIVLLGMLPLQFTHPLGWRAGAIQFGVAAVLLIILRIKKQSAWWAVPIAWFPI